MDYQRCLSITSKCVVPNCTNAYKKISDALRQRWLLEFKIYICKNTRCCQAHLNDSNLVNMIPKTSMFTPQQQRDLISLRDIAENLNTSIWPTQCKEWSGLTKDEVLIILSELPSLASNRKKEVILFSYLVKLRTGETDKRIAVLLKVKERRVNKYFALARAAIKTDFVPNHLGFGHVDRNQLLTHHTATSKVLFGNNVVLIWDGTYLYIQKSQNYDFQRKTYSMQKHRCLVKPMMVVTPDEYIVEVYSSFKAIDNDATILNRIFDSSESPKQYLQAQDVFLLDRGFRDCLPRLRREQITAHMPSFISPGETQLSWEAANKSRMVTRCRYAVEKVNGYMKTRFKLFNGTIYNSTLRHINDDFRNAAAIYNMFYHKGYNTAKSQEDEILADTLLNRLQVPNYLASLIRKQLRHNNNRHVQNIFQPIDRSGIVFPQLTLNDLKSISLGVYQIQQAERYLHDHIQDNEVDLNLCVANTEIVNTTQLAKYKITVTSPLLVRCRIKSRHSNSSRYYVYILIEQLPVDQGIKCIKHYYCDCKNGMRTSGCCSHVMCLIWYLGYCPNDIRDLRKLGQVHEAFFGSSLYSGKCPT